MTAIEISEAILRLVPDAQFSVGSGGLETLEWYGPGEPPSAEAIEAELGRAGDIARIAEINKRLRQIDAEAVRPLRAIAALEATQFDHDKIASLEAEAQSLRAERAELEGN